MKKITKMVLVIIALILTVTFFFLNKADYHGKIDRIQENSFYLFPLEIDPEAEYITPKIYFDNKTTVVGKVNNIEDLKDGQEIKVWLNESEDKNLADKIKVLNE